MEAQEFVTNYVVFAHVILGQLPSEVAELIKPKCEACATSMAKQLELDIEKMNEEIKLETQVLQYKLRYVLEHGVWPDE